MRQLAIPSMIAFFLVLSLASAASTCVTSSENYAAEVVFSDYNIFDLREMTTLTAQGYLAPSQYDESLLTIIKQTTNPEGLSVRLQVPTEISEIRRPFLRLVSTSSTGDFSPRDLENFGSWQISCSDNSCEFTKDTRKIIVNTIGESQEVVIEISEPLEECSSSCAGVCFSVGSESKCIDYSMENDFNTVLKFFRITDDFEDLLDDYRIIGSDEVIITDLQPVISPYINWQEAMRQELVHLVNNNILDLSRNDIEAISALSKRGQAGQNYRIIYDFDKQQWNYYNQVEGSILTSQRDCTEYSAVLPRLEEVKVEIKNYYLVPLIVMGAAVLLFIILIIIARSINASGKKKESLKD